MLGAIHFIWTVVLSLFFLVSKRCRYSYAWFTLAGNYRPEDTYMAVACSVNLNIRFRDIDIPRDWVHACLPADQI